MKSEKLYGTSSDRTLFQRGDLNAEKKLSFVEGFLVAKKNLQTFLICVLEEKDDVVKFQRCVHFKLAISSYQQDNLQKSVNN